MRHEYTLNLVHVRIVSAVEHSNLAQETPCSRTARKRAREREPHKMTVDVMDAFDSLPSGVANQRYTQGNAFKRNPAHVAEHGA